jgi:hypothetical protein
MPDPHRASGCWFEKQPSMIDTKPCAVENWFGLLDWAVYHAPGWEEWQEFRASLVGSPMEDRCGRIRSWYTLHQERNLRWFEKGLRTVQETQEDRLALAVRVSNILRSLRGQFSRYPELRTLLDEANRELNNLREGVSK